MNGLLICYASNIREIKTFTIGMIIQNEEVLMSQFEFIDKRVPIALDNPSIYHDISKCKNCTLCRRACADVILGGLHHSVHADLGDDHLHLDLGQQEIGRASCRERV